MNENLDFIGYISFPKKLQKEKCIFCKNEIEDKREHSKICIEYKNHSIKDRKYFFIN